MNPYRGTPRERPQQSNLASTIPTKALKEDCIKASCCYDATFPVNPAYTLVTIYVASILLLYFLVAKLKLQLHRDMHKCKLLLRL